VQLLDKREVLKRRGRGHSSHFNDIKLGLFVHPIAVGPRSRRYPDYEVDAINAARVAGKSDDEIRQLVATLEAARKGAA